MTVKILAVDDSVTMRSVYKMMFSSSEFELMVAASAAEAMKLAAMVPPDVVLADASMAGTDGYGLCKQIRQTASTARAAVLLMASAQHPYDSGKGSDAGVDDNFVKPFETGALIAKVSEIASRGHQAQARTPKQTIASSPPPVVSATAEALDDFDLEIEEEIVPGPTNPPAPFVAPAATRVPSAPPAVVAAAPVAAIPRAVERAVAPDSALGGKLATMGLSAEQIAGVLALSREVVEQVVWEVVPELAETLIKEEIARLMRP